MVRLSKVLGEKRSESFPVLEFARILRLHFGVAARTNESGHGLALISSSTSVLLNGAVAQREPDFARLAGVKSSEALYFREPPVVVAGVY